MPELHPAITAALAAFPILLILALMLGLQWSAARAGLAGLAAAAVLVATGPFGFGGGACVPAGFAGVAAEGAFTALTILWILWPALALHRHQERIGAIEVLRGGLGALTRRPLLQVLLVGWFLALFFEGAAGFGTPVALAAPMLVGLGVPAIPAVVLALLGHSIGVSFGALGTPVLAQANLVAVDPAALAWRTALLHAACGAILMVFFMRAARAAGLEPQAPAGRTAAWAGFAAAAFLLPSLLLAMATGPELATLGAALIGGILFAAVLRWSGPEARVPAPGLRRALWPYAVLVALVLVTRAWPAAREVLGQVQIAWSWGDFSGRMQPLAHPGTLLLLALVLGARLQRVPLSQLREPLAFAARRLLPVTVALLAMLWLSRLMLHGGLVGQLERAAVAGLGPAWPWVAPAVGALGSFVTGSATASNILFTSLQAQTAQALGLPLALMLAAQGFGAAIGNVVCPHNIVAGAATVGLAGREAAILRHTLWPCAAYLLAGGALLAWLAHRAPVFLR
jgi:lactate permease